MQPGDVRDTYADTTRLARAVNWRPATPIANGVARFVDWYRGYYGADGAAGLTRVNNWPAPPCPAYACHTRI